jgi:hypothetical protein
VSTPVVREHTDGVIAALETEGLTVGDAVAPEDVGPPYVVVYPIAGGSLSGSLANPDEDGALVFQVTCVGASREQAEWLADKAMALLDGFSVTGRSIARVSLDLHGGIQRDDAQTPPVFYALPRFRVMTTPA